MAGTSCCVVLLVAHLAGNTEGAHARGNGVEHLGRCFGKAGDWCLARDRVDGRLLRTNALKRRDVGVVSDVTFQSMKTGLEPITLPDTPRTTK